MIIFTHPTQCPALSMAAYSAFVFMVGGSFQGRLVSKHTAGVTEAMAYAARRARHLCVAGRRANAAAAGSALL